MCQRTKASQSHHVLWLFCFSREHVFLPVHMDRLKQTICSGGDSQEVAPLLSWSHCFYPIFTYPFKCYLLYTCTPYGPYLGKLLGNSATKEGSLLGLKLWPKPALEHLHINSSLVKISHIRKVRESVSEGSLCPSKHSVEIITFQKGQLKWKVRFKLHNKK